MSMLHLFINDDDNNIFVTCNQGHILAVKMFVVIPSAACLKIYKNWHLFELF